ncbi:MAG: xanthine dehydrogenase family protein molybdopterin-binding subunit [Candidatus Eremiobacteraeota bacterium]|nr:xanthine dehydrogenase family protein molybdopterin-binding subunit [Candidatus Eremiobacteraeota bacterium]MBV8356283.1 xanthine dehydrogenase family protein molybdopterin-binding subunit [Candidatus Eremiobacteraeota bacterium]
MQSGIIYGLTAALFGEISIANGRVAQHNFYDYQMVHLAQAPRMEVSIIASNENPGGVGEPGTPPIAPAVANAIFAATGKRVRTLPLTKAGFTA